MEQSDTSDKGDAIAANAVTRARDVDELARTEAVIERVLGASDLFEYAESKRVPERVNLPWIAPGAHVFVLGLDSAGKDVFDDTVYSVDATTNKLVANVKGVRALMICLCTVDEQGNRLFTQKDLPKLARMDSRTSDAIYVKAARLSNLTQKDVDDIVKNSEGDRSGGRS